MAVEFVLYNDMECNHFNLGQKSQEEIFRVSPLSKSSSTTSTMVYDPISGAIFTVGNGGHLFCGSKQVTRKLYRELWDMEVQRQHDQNLRLPVLMAGLQRLGCDSQLGRLMPDILCAIARML
jgi:hypothetical protein